MCGEQFHAEVAFDHFVLIETLGVGGMGSVYKARDTRLDRFVALKILRRELSAQPEETARLEQEARLTAAVNHPHIVQMFSSGNAHGQFYLVMELVDFGSLDDLMAEHGKLPELQVVEIGIQIAQGLQAAQEKGLIHRDIKPANILFGDERTAKIGDFGLAVAAGQNAETQHEIWGTPYYVAPERLNNEPEDSRSDIFSLGATLYHALTGTAPIDAETTSATELRELKSRPPDLRSVAPQLSRATRRAIAGMMVPDPRARFQSYAEVIAALTRVKERLDGTASGRLFSRRNIIAAVALILILGAVGVYFYRAQQRLATLAARGGDEMTLSLTKSYDDARRQLIAGKYDAARTAFTRLSEQAQDRQPLLNWIRLHRGFAALLRGYRNAAEQPFQEIEKGGRFSTKPEEAETGDFFVATARAVLAPNSISAVDAARTKPKALEPFATLLFGLKDWQQGDFQTAAALLEQFVHTDSTGAFSWINEYRPLAQRYLADYRTYSDWKTLSQSGCAGFERSARRAATDRVAAASAQPLE
ncbi:MAG: serine/threonine protein kinase [Verrucomicrobiota bacterium]|nr:serine/threonine protein kinase [Verrucomicrobiota bacterium]